MKYLFELITSPFGLPISPLYEYLLLAGIGAIAFRVAYDLAGLFGSSAVERKEIHWFVRLIVFILLWAITYAIIWVIRNKLLAFIIACSIAGTLILIWLIRSIISSVKKRKMRRK